MKIAITATDKDKESKASPVFGRCPYFAIVDEEMRFIENGAKDQRGGAGMAAAQTIGDQGAKAVLTGKVGPNAFNVLERIGIEVYAADTTKSVKENEKLFREGKLEKIEEVTGKSGTGRGGRRR